MAFKVLIQWHQAVLSAKYVESLQRSCPSIENVNNIYTTYVSTRDDVDRLDSERQDDQEFEAEIARLAFVLLECPG